MTQDPFGNLRDWGPVLDLLEELVNSGRLDDCQTGLIRILRYQGNWRLREEALKMVGRIAHPGEKLVAQVLRIVADDNIYYEARILASQALSALAPNWRRQAVPPAATDVQAAADKIRQLLSTPQPPFFHQALSHCLQALA